MLKYTIPQIVTLTPDFVFCGTITEQKGLNLLKVKPFLSE